MEDFIKREIDKIGLIIKAILLKVGLLKESGDRGSVPSVTKIELAEKLNMDLDGLVAGEDVPGVLIREYGFSNDNLEKFAELLMDFIETSPGRATARKYVPAVISIYDYLHENASDFSFNSYYALKELEKYM